MLDLQGAADDPTALFQTLSHCRRAPLPLWIVFCHRKQHANTPHAISLLGVRGERPRDCGSCYRLDKVAPSHGLPQRLRQRQPGCVITRAKQDFQTDGMGADSHFYGARAFVPAVSALGHSRHPRYPDMSAVPPICDMPANGRNVPTTDIGLLDHLVGTAEQRQRHREAEAPGGIEVDNELDFHGLLDRQIGRLFTL
jgi:hypothetical protein